MRGSVEVEVDGFTGCITCADRYPAVGDSISPLVDRGQIEGAIPPATWPLVRTHAGSGRKLLFVGIHATRIVGMTVPEGRMLLMDLLEHATQPDVIMGSKATGEPPLMLAFSVREALREAVASFAAERGPEVVSFDSPATPERIFFAVRRVRHATGVKRPGATSVA